jgi:hypothetical protein
MKAREVYLSRNQKYIKAKDEDLKSTLGGIINPKGRIHYALGKPLNQYIDSINSEKQSNNYLAAIAQQIDRQIYKNYKLWPTNYLAYDLLEKSSKYAGIYDNELKEKFDARFNRIKEVIPEGDMNELKDIFLKIYANPVYNQLSIQD